MWVSMLVWERVLGFLKMRGPFRKSRAKEDLCCTKDVKGLHFVMVASFRWSGALRPLAPNPEPRGLGFRLSGLG